MQEKIWACHWKKPFNKYLRLGKKKKKIKIVACLQIGKNIHSAVQDEFESNMIPFYGEIAFEMFSSTSCVYFSSRELIQMMRLLHLQKLYCAFVPDILVLVFSQHVILALLSNQRIPNCSVKLVFFLLFNQHSASKGFCS